MVRMTSGRRIGPILLRVGLPCGIAIAGLVLALLGGTTNIVLAAALLPAALVVALTDVFARLTISSQRDRDEEQAARENFSRTGRWPGARGTGRRPSSSS
jgi:hypothetical protein